MLEDIFLSSTFCFFSISLFQQNPGNGILLLRSILTFFPRSSSSIGAISTQEFDIKRLRLLGKPRKSHHPNANPKAPMNHGWLSSSFYIHCLLVGPSIKNNYSQQKMLRTTGINTINTMAKTDSSICRLEATNLSQAHVVLSKAAFDVETTQLWWGTWMEYHWIMYLEAICPLFCLQKKGFSNQNKGHLDSRYISKLSK